ncbi:non-specific phospholipase C6-like [Telopea speciosissima]|uniref:non-specific phospholipase C6-like n=1 Tax=Telopea speciosissima TaxID=54955 RepID=UPI001CC4D919|nr:non-specific phospholipase C6-like [Telopea speciosissima]
MEHFKTKPSKFLSTFFIFLILSSVLFQSTFSAFSTQQPIKTIVVLMMENRSFDHMIGWMQKSVNPLINGVNGTQCNPVSTKSPQSQLVCVTDDAEYVDPNPGHSYQEIRDQVFGINGSQTPSMTGFVEQALSMSTEMSETVMKGFHPNSVPVYASLVSEFAVYDRWFASIPASTQPNRLFTFSATSYGTIGADKFQIFKGYPQKTIFDSLHEDGVDFGIYFQAIPTTLVYRNLRKLRYIPKFHQFDLTFKRHARQGILPNFTVIEPRYFDLLDLPANDDHPSHDVANGQKFVKEVYEALRSSPQWNQTLLVITYDEHGGFFDHVPTPVNVPNPDGKTGLAPYHFKFDRLGVRVPTIMVSPWIKKGTVVSRANGPTPSSEFEHSSIPATVKKIFNLSSDFLTQRDAWAGTFEEVVGELSSPRTDCPEVLPEVTPLRNTSSEIEGRSLSEFQQEVVHLAVSLNGDHTSGSFNEEIIEKMTVREGHEYVNNVVSNFIRASQEAIKLDAPESAIVDMMSFTTTTESMFDP